jgi:drug/metabolite transporter (DMT)-like permease
MTTVCLDTEAGRKAGQQVETAVWLGLMVLLWGLSWPAMKTALASVPPFWLAALRFSSAGILLFLFCLMRGRLAFPARKDWPIVLSVGGLQMMAFTGLGLTAMQFTEAGRAAVLAYTTPLWGVIAAWLIVSERPTHWQILSLVVGLSGVALICSPLSMDWTQPSVLLGNGLLLAAAICWSIVILHVRRHVWAGRPIDIVPWQMLFAAVPLVILAALFEGSLNKVAWTPELTGLIVYIGPIATAVCFVVSSEYGRRVSTFTMSNVTMGVPVIGLFSSSFLLRETLSAPLVAGVVLVIAGAVLSALAIWLKATKNAATAARDERLAQSPQAVG